tara:strand:+ start:93 stop:356 length:264 start_codon:yes stop_codon:yes gene_type:complete
MKQIFETHLNQIWTKWLRTESYFDRLKFDIDENFFNNPKTQDYCIEGFLMEHEDKLSERQRNFANHILQVMVEVQNHEHIDKTLLKK